MRNRLPGELEAKIVPIPSHHMSFDHASLCHYFVNMIPRTHERDGS